MAAPWEIAYKDLASPRTKQILASLKGPQRRSMLARLGAELELQLKRHFTARDQEGNKRGWPRSHFWIREGRNKTALRSITNTSALVGVASVEIAHKLRGGTIRPGPGRRALALPLRAEAAGVLPRAGTIPGLFVLRSKAVGKLFLATTEPSGALRVFWKLVPSVTQEKDPRTLPPVADIRAALEVRAEKEMQRVIAQSGQ
jgi:hypothetical protein